MARPPRVTRDRKIFISYRWIDSAGASGRLYDRLRDHFGAKCIFMDEDIHSGEHFPKRLVDEIKKTDTMLVVVGPSWADARDDVTGDLRLRNPQDWVRREIELANANDCRLFPVLVGGALVPRVKQLPKNIRWVFDFQAQVVQDFDRDVQALIARLERPSRDLFASWSRLRNLAPFPALLANALLKPCHIAFSVIVASLSIRWGPWLAVLGIASYVALTTISFFTLVEARWVASRIALTSEERNRPRSLRSP